MSAAEFPLPSGPRGWSEMLGFCKAVLIAGRGAELRSAALRLPVGEVQINPGLFQRHQFTPIPPPNKTI